MPPFGHRNPRRSRSTKLEITAQQGTLRALLARLKDRDVVARLALCLLGLVVLSLVVEGWRSPFKYRRGDRPAHGILATVNFQRENRRQTDRLRDQKESSVPLYFRSQPLPQDSLVDQLRSDFQSLVDVTLLDELPLDVRQAFGLLPASSETSTASVEAASLTKRFHDLRDLINARDQLPAEITEQVRIERVEGLLAEFQQLLRVLAHPGVISDDDVKRLQIGPAQRLAVTLETARSGAIEDGGIPGRIESLAGRADVDLQLAMKPGGRIASVWGSIPLLATQRPAIEAWLLTRVNPTLTYDRSATQQARLIAREDVELIYEPWYEGQVVVGPGEVIGDEELDILQHEYAAAEAKVPFILRIARMGTTFLMMLILAFINGAYIVRNERRLVQSGSRIAIYLGVITIAVVLGRFASTSPLRGEVVPVIASAMILAVAYNQILAALTALTISLILTLSTVGDLSQFVVLVSVSATATILLSSVPSRSTLIKVGFVCGFAWFIVFCGLTILHSPSTKIVWSNEGQLLMDGLRGAAWCLGAGFLVAGSLPFIERSFGVVTDISLLEMSDISHPLLQELVRRAPGTYNHSITVASIAESAAEAIGANGLLVRVGAYFHDIGKMLKPEYFVENMAEGARSRHADLAPAMSTLIIIGHVKDGVDLALRHHLPTQIIDFIEQHHGTTLVRFFFHEARKQAEGDADHRTDAEESSFRYPGPRPQTREAGVMMLADAVESASRTLVEPTPRRIETLVHQITMDKLLDGQFEESSLTLSEIRTIEDSLMQSLVAIYHGRIKYPELQRA